MEKLKLTEKKYIETTQECYVNVIKKTTVPYFASLSNRCPVCNLGFGKDSVDNSYGGPVMENPNYNDSVVILTDKHTAYHLHDSCYVKAIGNHTP